MTKEYVSGKATEPILVSISCITYNHAPYIRQCLDGFMMQKTNFAFEVLIHDDASTDGTTDIIKEYEAQYPDIIKPIYEEENQWVKRRRGSAVFNFPRANGKYIALCEGDDYWTDPLKLQKQVDFLEKNAGVTMCFANAIQHYENGLYEDSLVANIENRFYSGVEIFKSWQVATATVMFRYEIYKSDLYQSVQNNPKFIFGDILLFLTCANYGAVYGMGDVFATYRRHDGGLVLSMMRSPEAVRLFCKHILEIPRVFGEMYRPHSERGFHHTCMSVFFDGKHNGIDFKNRLSFLKDSFAHSRFKAMVYFIRFVYGKLKKLLNQVS